MITGAAQADVAVLVVSARQNEFEAGFLRGGQTVEHAILAKTLGVDRLLVVVNKMDDESVQWSRERYEQIRKELGSFIRKLKYTEVQFIPISGYKGINVQDKMESSICTWYNGPSLLEALDELPPIERNVTGSIRVPILDKGKDERGQVWVLGKVEQGTIKRGQKVTVNPNKIECEVIKLEINEEEVDTVMAGDNCRIFINGDDENIYGGHVMCSPGDLLDPVTEFVGQFKLLGKELVVVGYEAEAHIHTAQVRISLEAVLAVYDQRTGAEKSAATLVRKGDLVKAKFKLSKPVCLEKFDVLPAMGRFAIREDTSIGVGRILLKKKAN
jgi:peptide chain release factor subunit 3